MIPLTASSSPSSGLVDSIVEVPRHFADVAAHDPLSAVFLAIGALFVALPVAILGYLSAGALLSVFTVEETPRPPQRAE